MSEADAKTGGGRPADGPADEYQWHTGRQRPHGRPLRDVTVDDINAFHAFARGHGNRDAESQRADKGRRDALGGLPRPV